MFAALISRLLVWIVADIIPVIVLIEQSRVYRKTASFSFGSDADVPMTRR